MCGIAGFVGTSGVSMDDVHAVASMTAALRHRGPDDAGAYADSDVALGMRRLSIIDLDGARQPLRNEDGSLVLVANGEIYNYLEIRKSLHRRGHELRTRGDCETILHLYEDHGLDFIHRLRGMFAFALWDRGRRRLILARDRMGEKPLYLFESDDGLYFASEMKALLQSHRVPFQLEPSSVDLYFHYQYVPEPATMVRGVRKLAAASLLVVDLPNWDIQQHRYWNLLDAPPLEGSPSVLLRDQLEDVSELIVRADVPVGVALSGGLDSSVVAALAARRQSDLRAFSVGYPGRPHHDERAQAREFAEHLGISCEEIEVSTNEVVDFFPELVYRQDDPIADIAGYGYYAVNRLAHRKGVPVLLQGQGGDELFWGYHWVRRAAMETERKQALVKQGWHAWAQYLRPKPLEHLGPRSFLRWVAEGFGVREGLQELQRHSTAPPDQMVFYDLNPEFAAGRSLYASTFREALQGSSAKELFRAPHPWPRADLALTQLICDTYLLENGIAQGDRLSMASSVELRLPLVDHRFVETVIGLRKSGADHALAPKARLRDAVDDLLPTSVKSRRKRGFEPPVHEWMTGIIDRYGSTLPGGYLEEVGVLRHGITTESEREHRPTLALFRALVLESWCRAMQSADTRPLWRHGHHG